MYQIAAQATGYINRIFQRRILSYSTIFSSPIPSHLRVVDWGHHPIMRQDGDEEGGASMKR
jgi:hypothetical protein